MACIWYIIQNGVIVKKDFNLHKLHQNKRIREELKERVLPNVPDLELTQNE
jgi:hypothetical protein